MRAEEEDVNESDADRRSMTDRRRRENPAVVAGEVEKKEVVAAEMQDAAKGKLPAIGEEEKLIMEEEEMNESQGDRRNDRRESAAVVAGEVETHEGAEEAKSKEERLLPLPYWHCTRTDLAYCLLLCSALALLCLAWFLLVVYGGVANRYIWVSCLFAPFGSLTTVSTFIGELYALPPVPFAYAYIIATLGMTQAALIPINGLYTWLQ
ncbi:uncharacterized protein ACA1_073680 [Acanthamoeba castellanii str. Neff]|uniref:Transmembrane protein n=1 Tax=Acanthamoeba castellanii (strain ATCC 30010 / Neff) TaxID=1257118 RepID=L8HER0_ACACF|nr:uncharacterized protein ACA1_073680 [Acanthamoeba castellanii str. Neff]ELR23722.1 hypothetical protein ACA1_073680 [Acanthamoeba castellanii str. Neff]